MKPLVYVHYVEDCTPKIKKFRTTKAAARWVENFQRKYDGQDDHWYDFTIEGRVVNVNEYYGEMVFGKMPVVSGGRP